MSKRKGRRRCLACSLPIRGSTYDDAANDTPGPFCGPCLGLPAVHRGAVCIGCDHPITGRAYRDDGVGSTYDAAEDTDHGPPGPFCGPCLGRRWR